MTDLDQRSYFFDEGIRFECRRCGDCCTGDPGIVRVNEREIECIAAYLGTPISAVVETFIYSWEDGHSIKEASDGRCLFFEDGCRIYPARPTQCRTFPFWFANLRSEARWKKIRHQCPGIGTGHLYSKADILAILSRSSDRRP
ncbi:MAG: YkgJ family cysteine cluster protein [Deltaproteobacteria bacterium]|nr:YkgJ family cysteine cluster protein [Deltaproteobacteria bacterium]